MKNIALRPQPSASPDLQADDFVRVVEKQFKALSSFRCHLRFKIIFSAPVSGTLKVSVVVSSF